MAKEERKFKVCDGSAREQKFSTGLNPSFTAPPGIPMWKPKRTGGAAHSIDILPFLCTERHDDYVDELRFGEPGGLYGERTFKVHSKIGVNEQSYTCIAATFGHRCPVCEEISRLKESPHQLDRDKAYKLKPKVRQLFLVHDHDEPDKGIQLWEQAHWNFGRFLDAYIAGASKKDRPAYRRYYDPYEGYSMRLMVLETTIESGKNYEYHVHGFTKRDQPLPKELYDHGIDLDNLVRELDYDTLRAVYFGAAEDEDAVDEDDDRKPQAARDESRNVKPGRGESPNGAAAKSHPTKPTEPEPDEDSGEYPLNGGDEEVEYASRDVVSFVDDGDTLEGVVEKVDRAEGRISVRVDGYRKPIVVELSDPTLTLVKRDDTFDAKPQAEEKPAKPAPAKAAAPKPAAKSASGWDDGDDDGRTKPPAKAPPKRR